MKFLKALCLLPVCLSAAAPPASAQEETPRARFVVYGDTRNGHRIHGKLIALMLQIQPALVLQTGDLVARSSGPEWRTYDRITRPLRHHIPLYAARGNHDVGGTGFSQRAGVPLRDAQAPWYAFDAIGAHFVVLDCYSATGARSAQIRFLHDDLARCEARRIPAFVFFHEGPYSVGIHGSNRRLRAAFVPIFTKYHVAAVFNGHDHLYYRTVRDGIPYFVTGGGGAPLYPCRRRAEMISGDRCFSAHHLLLCEIMRDSLRVRALDPDGRELDRFEFALHNSASHEPAALQPGAQ